MRKLNAIFILCGIFFSKSVFANDIDTQLVDQINSGTTSQETLKFQQVKSCESIETMLEKYAKERPIYRYNNLKTVDFVEDIAIESTAVNKNFEAQGISSSSNEYSTTNIQKQWVDEPEILKTDWKYYYYYNNKLHKISIIESPLDIQNKTLNSEKVQIIKEIAIPKSINKVELFVAKNRLIILGNQYLSEWSDLSLFEGERSILAIYDVSNIKEPQLIKFQNIPGYYQDARLIDDKLSIITEQGINRYQWKAHKKELKIGLNSIEITDDKTRINTIDCDEISYILPEDEKNANQFNPVFTIISSVNIQDTEKKSETTALLAPNGEIHMSKDSLYMVSPYYHYKEFHCPIGFFCTSSYYSRGTYGTIIHKFSRDGLKFDYQDSVLANGSLLNQYSMDEDDQENFRILTRGEKGTNLYIFDEKLQLKGKLENIEPSEEFKSSRYIGDKLYLVTFETIDPLFVIDLQAKENPSIIGALEIPWYSKYLHPLKKEWNKQYLIGLGYNTKENNRWGIQNNGLKISLFEIDYGTIVNNQISIKELSHLDLWSAGSDTEVLDNPRLFVMDSQGTVTLPVTVVTEKNNWQSCNITYDVNGKEISRDCRDQVKTEYFVGIKRFSISPEEWIKETYSKDYLEENTKKMLNIRNQRELKQNMRIGFAGDALFNINDLFADFIFPDNTSKTILFTK